ARALIASLTLSESDYHAIELQLEAAFRAGLSATGPPQCVPMLCSHGRAPSGGGGAAARGGGGGHGQSPGPGDYLALDLGGTNYRVLLVRMRPPGQPPEIVENVYSVPGELMRAAASTCSTSGRHHCRLYGRARRRPSGRKSGRSASPRLHILVPRASSAAWPAPDCSAGPRATRLRASLATTCVSCCSQEAIDRRGLAARCVALVNDTVGTLAACALEDPACMIGLIVGSRHQCRLRGAAAVDKYSTELPAGRVGLSSTRSGATSEPTAVWNGSELIWIGSWTRASINPGRQTFEKLVSGMYLGELVRLAIQQLVSDGVLFDGRMPEALRQPMSFHTKYLSEVERDPPRHYYSTDSLLTVDLGLQLVRPLDMMTVRAASVSTRSAYLVATGISCLLKRIGSPDDVTRMIDKINELHPDAKFLLRLSEDGSGKGAAAIAAMA
uniref:Phosphotransferase n=1 Tax=Macrostomum lignano TaxID=282301 RepID=A0A1I8F2R0_9PLAT